MAPIYCEEICSLNFPNIKSFIPTLGFQNWISKFGFPTAAIGLYGSTVSCCWVSCSLSLSSPAWYYCLTFGHPTPAYHGLTCLPYYFGCRCKSDIVFTTGVVGIRFSSSSSSVLFEAPQSYGLVARPSSRFLVHNRPL